jgi:hypothetical protein
MKEVIADARPNLNLRKAQELEELIADCQDIFETNGAQRKYTTRSIPATPYPFTTQHADTL